MKRIVSIFLLLALAFSLASCIDTPPQDTSSDTSFVEDSGQDTGGNAYTPPPILDYDKQSYEARYHVSGLKLHYGKTTIPVPVLSDYYKDKKAALSMTFDDGYDVNTGYIVSDVFSQYGFKGTAMLGHTFMSNLVSQWQEVISLGYLDVGCHGYSHKDPVTITSAELEQEIKGGIEFLRESFPGQEVLTFATPFARITPEYETYLKDYVIANRLETAGNAVMPGNGIDNIYKVLSQRVDSSSDMNSVVLNIANTVENKGWFVALYHCVVTGSNPTGTDINETVFRDHCKWLYDTYGDTIWFGSFEEVSKYVRQREGAKLEYTACDAESLTFMLTVPECYDMAMTTKFYFPTYADSAYAVINDEIYYLDIFNEYGVKCAYIDVPVSEEGTEIKIYLGNNSTYLNNCVHAYQQSDIILPTETAIGYTEMMCTKCDHTYKKQFTNIIE